jgi:ubiquitin carboxyl-terminal hydrolase 7
VQSTHSFLVPKASSIKELSELLASNVKVSTDGTGSGRIRVFQNDRNRKQLPYSGSELIRDTDVNDLYAEEIPLEEVNANEQDDKLVGAYHFSKEPARSHGVPFTFVIKPVRPLLLSFC